MFVKICGTTNLPDAELAVAEGADALGFIFAQSKRQVSVAQAAAITSQLRPGVERVGVFTSGACGEIVKAVCAAGLTAVQLHSAQDPELLRCLHAEFGNTVELWQVVSYEIALAEETEAEGGFVRALAAAMEDERVAVVLLDTARAGASGGLGASFPWEKAATLVKQASAMVLPSPTRGDLGLPRILVAGGLTAENVAEAIRLLEPWGVDCVSGVEAEPGRKDPQRLAAFVAAARGGC